MAADQLDFAYQMQRLKKIRVFVAYSGTVFLTGCFLRIFAYLVSLR
jgi:hypothetical protein